MNRRSTSESRSTWFSGHRNSSNSTSKQAKSWAGSSTPFRTITSEPRCRCTCSLRKLNAPWLPPAMIRTADPCATCSRRSPMRPPPGSTDASLNRISAGSQISGDPRSPGWRPGSASLRRRYVRGATFCCTCNKRLHPKMSNLRRSPGWRSHRMASVAWALFRRRRLPAADGPGRLLVARRASPSIS